MAARAPVTTCYRHPDRETGVSCSNCGRPICPDCMTATSVGMRCPECSRERTKVRTVRNLVADPTVTYVLIGINAAAFIGSLASGAGGGFGQPGGSLLAEGALSRVGVAEGHYWQLITSGFLHANLLHIGFNMYLLYVLGQMIEPSVGHVRFAALYFTSLLAGSFGALLLSPHGSTIGASGAVFGLMGGAVMMMRARGFDPMASGIPLLIGLNLVFSFVVPGVSIGGHVGGLIGGAVAGFLLVGVGDRLRSPVLPLLACTGLAALAVAGSIAVA